MAHNAHLLNNMNLNPETLKLAKTILREATLKTKPGSGYEIRSLSTGLPAICAFIACDRYEFVQSWKHNLRRCSFGNYRLQTNELTRRTAQIASCLKSTDLAKAVNIVKAAIGADPAPQSGQATRETFNSPGSRPFPETPTKKRKLDDFSRDSPKKSATATPLRSILRTLPRKGSTTFTPSRVKLDVARLEPEEQPDSDEEMEPGPLPALNFARGHNPSSEGSASDAEPDSEEDVDRSMIDDAGLFLTTPNRRQSVKARPVSIRRFRPVYLDFKQWNTLDPRLQVVYARA